MWNFVDFFFNNVDSYAKEFVKNKGNPDDLQGNFEFSLEQIIETYFYIFRLS
jgi:hypothetical protein